MKNRHRENRILEHLAYQEKWVSLPDLYNVIDNLAMKDLMQSLDTLVMSGLIMRMECGKRQEFKVNY